MPQKQFSVVESLESRRLFTTLPSGFVETKVTELPTDVATAETFAPDGRLFIIDHNNANVRIYKNGSLLATPFVSVPQFGVSGPRGVDGIAVDPQNEYVYLWYTRVATATKSAAQRLSRFKMNPSNKDVKDPNTAEQILLDNINTHNGDHNGGAMAFGADGMLYLAVGDAGASVYAQDMNVLNGKVIRINARDPAHLIPADNPFVGQAGKRGEIWASGFRNPFSGDMKPGTNQFYVNDVGQATWEEINDIQKGKNYGWPNAEGNSTNPAYTNPVYAYPHGSSGASITGGAFYTNKTQFPAQYQNSYYFADYTLNVIRRMDLATKTVTTFATNNTAPFLDLDVAPDGSLYALEVSGRVYKISYAGSGVNRAPTAVANATTPTAGDSPLTVGFSGAGSSDPDGDAITYRWHFGDGTSATGTPVNHTYATNGTFFATLDVTDSKNATTTSSAIKIIAGEHAPVATINSPADQTLYRAGNTINFSGTANDQEDGTLAASQFYWSVYLFHNTHTHPVANIDGVKSGSFVIPTTGETDADVFYRVYLTVVDSAFLKTTTSVDVVPRKSTFTLASNVPGLTVTLDGQPKTTPLATLGVVGVTRTLGAPVSQSLNGKFYQFESWSDGGAATHNISTPDADTTYTATFKEVPAPAELTVTASADAFVRDGNFATTNYGTATELATKKSTSGFTRETYLKFDLTGVGAIGTAKLRIYGASTDATSLSVGLFSVNDITWSENAINYSNKPAAGASALTQFTVASTTAKFYEIDVTNYLKQQKSAGKTGVSFALKGTASSAPYAAINSRETVNPPRLVFTEAAPSTTTTLGTTADAYVRDGTSTGTNFGSATQLIAKNSGVGTYREIAMKFNLASVASISNAKLRLFGSINDPASGATALAAYGSNNTTWTEASVTYNSRPAIAGSALSTLTVPDNIGRYYEFDVTSFLAAQKSAGKDTVTIVIRATSTNTSNVLFNSKEAGANAPQLVVTT